MAINIKNNIIIKDNGEQLQLFAPNLSYNSYQKTFYLYSTGESLFVDKAELYMSSNGSDYSLFQTINVISEPDFFHLSDLEAGTYYFKARVLGRNFIPSDFSEVVEVVILPKEPEYKLSEDGTYYIVAGRGGLEANADVVIPDTYNGLPVKEIGSSAFNSSNIIINSISLPNSITKLGSYCFGGQSKITSFVIPNGVISIGESAFGSCSGLISITIPSSVTSIGHQAFGNITGSMSLSEITFMHTASDPLTLGTNVFKVKTARAMTVNYYGNQAVADYNYAGDNITATLNDLSQGE